MVVVVVVASKTISGTSFAHPPTTAVSANTAADRRRLRQVIPINIRFNDSAQRESSWRSWRVDVLLAGSRIKRQGVGVPGAHRRRPVRSMRLHSRATLRSISASFTGRLIPLRWSAAIFDQATSSSADQPSRQRARAASCASGELSTFARTAARSRSRCAHSAWYASLRPAKCNHDAPTGAPSTSHHAWKPIASARRGTTWNRLRFGFANPSSGRRSATPRHPPRPHSCAGWLAPTNRPWPRLRCATPHRRSTNRPRSTEAGAGGTAMDQLSLTQRHGPMFATGRCRRIVQER